MLKLIKNAMILQDDFEFSRGHLLIQDDIIKSMFSENDELPTNVDISIDASNLHIFPGLINAHDHLAETGEHIPSSSVFNNWYDWQTSIKNTPQYKATQKLSLTDLYLLGMYKNVISGVTTIVDHFPPEAVKAFWHHPLTSLLEHYFIAHSASTKSLTWGRSVDEEYKSSRGILPFIIHIGEGISSELQEEIDVLDRKDILRSNTVLVNATHLAHKALDLIALNKASLVWLPISSQNVFGKQPDIEHIMKCDIPFAIGTDSSITGSTTLLENLKFALNHSNEYLNGKLTPQKIIKMVTIDAAKIFKIDNDVGSLKAGKTANLIAVEVPNSLDPFEALINKNAEDILMVLHKGELIWGEYQYRKLSSASFALYSEVKINQKDMILYGNPLRLLERISYKTGNPETPIFFPIMGESD